ncbi:MAG: DNA-formamidopyrimidine glycosylase family protein, partial [Chloroflexota bacterium]
MPEGDTIHRVATVLRRALADRVVTGFEVVAPRVTSDAQRFEIVGSVVRSVESNGKHLLIAFARGDDDVVLHTHLKMTGMWHIYRPGERWWEPRSDARVVITTDAFVAPCFRPPVVELMASREIALHAVLPRLGPDIIRDEFDEDEALRRLRASPPERDIATALLDQRTISGIGNVFKCEALFLERVSPWAKVADLDDATLRRLAGQARKLMRLNRAGGERRTRFALNAAEGMWVDERTGLPCHVCGT